MAATTKQPLSYRVGNIAGSVVRGFRDAQPQAREWAVDFADQQAMKTRGEIGFSGLTIFNGLIDDEYQEDLADFEARITLYEKMRADADVATLLTALELPLLAAKYEVKPNPDATDQKHQEEMCDALNKNLFEGMTITWTNFLRHAYRALFDGVSWFEKVWEDRDGETVWRKFAPRKASTIYRWHLDEGGGLAGITQQGYRAQNDGSTFETVPQIGIEKLLVCTYRPDYGNPQGRGLLRDVYRHWYYKDKLYTAAAIRIERLACPTPIAMPVANKDGLYPQLTDAQKKALYQAIARLRVYQEGGLILPDGFALAPFEMGEANVPWLDFITHQGGMILRAGLAQFLALGQDGAGGAYALAQDTSSFFLLALQAHAQWLCDVMNRYAIPQRVDLNWGAKDGLYPQLEVTNLGVKEKKAVAELMRLLAGAQENLLERKDEIGNVIREAVDLPEIPQEEIDAEAERKQAEQDAMAAMREKAVATAGQPAPQQPPMPPQGMKNPGAVPKPALPKAPQMAEDGTEEPAIEFADATLDKQLDAAQTGLQSEGKRIAQDMIDQYVRKLTPLAEAQDYAAMAEVKVPLVGKYENWLKRYLAQVVDLGRAALQRTAGVEPGPKSRAVTAWTAAKANVMAETHAASLRSAVLNTMLRDLQAGKPAAQVAKTGEAVMASEITRRLQADLPEAAQEATQRLQ